MTRVSDTSTIRLVGLSACGRSRGSCVKKRSVLNSPWVFSPLLCFYTCLQHFASLTFSPQGVVATGPRRCLLKPERGKIGNGLRDQGSLHGVHAASYQLSGTGTDPLSSQGLLLSSKHDRRTGALQRGPAPVLILSEQIGAPKPPIVEKAVLSSFPTHYLKSYVSEKLFLLGNNPVLRNSPNIHALSSGFQLRPAIQLVGWSVGDVGVEVALRQRWLAWRPTCAKYWGKLQWPRRKGRQVTRCCGAESGTARHERGCPVLHHTSSAL